ncbi:MAG: hypothetical protein V8K32_15140 [Candidatus Electrothrix gigas]
MLQSDNNRTFLDRIGLYLLFLLLAINPFHFKISVSSEGFISGFIYYYREIISFVFMMLWLSKIIYLKNWNNRICYQGDNRIYFFLIIFPILLGIFAVADSGTDLYSTNYLITTNLKAYLLRNALLYIPMTLYLAVRGLDEKEVQQVAWVIVIIAPFSIITFLISSEIATVRTIGVVAEMGGRDLAYNSYVPYLTIPILSGIYIIFSNSVDFFGIKIRITNIVKLFLFFIVAFVSVYIFLSTSRQSTLYIILAGTFTLLKVKKSFAKKIFTIFILIICITYTFSFLTEGYSVSNKLLDRFSSVSGMTDSNRLDKILYGLSLLQPVEYFIGAGLTSVMVSGPHNDYIRWWQRVGFFAMFIGFLPFLMAFLKGYRLIRYHSVNILYIYVTLFVSFTLYHSFFGYPREDAYQAPYCFLGLAIWFGVRKAESENGNI